MQVPQKTIKQSVSFSPLVECFVEDYRKELSNEVWYSEDEIQNNLIDVAECLLRRQNGLPDNDTFCTDGLEMRFSASNWEQRQLNRVCVVHNVLEEQHQKTMNICSHQGIAQAAEFFTHHDNNLAIQRARKMYNSIYESN